MIKKLIFIVVVIICGMLAMPSQSQERSAVAEPAIDSSIPVEIPNNTLISNTTQCDVFMFTGESTDEIDVYRVRDAQGNAVSEFVTTYSAPGTPEEIADMTMAWDSISSSGEPNLFVLGTNGHLYTFDTIYDNFVEHIVIANNSPAHAIRSYRDNWWQSNLMIVKGSPIFTGGRIATFNKNGVLLNIILEAPNIGERMPFDIALTQPRKSINGSEISFSRWYPGLLPDTSGSNDYVKIPFNLANTSYGNMTVFDLPFGHSAFKSVESVRYTDAIPSLDISVNATYSMTFLSSWHSNPNIAESIFRVMSIKGEPDWFLGAFINNHDQGFDQGELKFIHKIRYFEGHLYVSHAGGISRFDVVTGDFIDRVTINNGLVSSTDHLPAMTFRIQNCLS